MLGKVMNDELKSFRKEMICGLVKLIFQNLTGGSEELHKKASG
jgi:hypothetical protein